jgi:hypothetical protein
MGRRQRSSWARSTCHMHRCSDVAVCRCAAQDRIRPAAGRVARGDRGGRRRRTVATAGHSAESPAGRISAVLAVLVGGRPAPDRRRTGIRCGPRGLDEPTPAAHPRATSGRAGCAEIRRVTCGSLHQCGDRRRRVPDQQRRGFRRCRPGHLLPKYLAVEGRSGGRNRLSGLAQPRTRTAYCRQGSAERPSRVGLRQPARSWCRPGRSRTSCWSSDWW